MNATACHFHDQLLERYAMGQLSAQESESVEEHLLLCPACQDRLLVLDDFIQVMKAALAVPTSPPAKLTVRISIENLKRAMSQSCS
jgi:anti-sigma factor RsiW